MPLNYRLGQNSFHDKTTISYALPRRSFVTLEVVDSHGASVRQLVSHMHEPGEYDVCWEGTDDNGDPVDEGLYLCRMTARAAGGGAFMQSCQTRLKDKIA